MSGYRIAIVGATGAVGRELAALLEERAFPAAGVRLMASGRQPGRRLKVLGKGILVEDAAAADPKGIEIAFFSAGAERSRRLAPSFAAAGAWVIDNSSAFRRDPEVPLVVPEINGRILMEGGNRREGKHRLVANPNCSTIVALLPLAALNEVFGLDRVLVSTYQAVSGAGGAALEELISQIRSLAAGEPPEARKLPRVIAHNLIPWIGDRDDAGYCEEENKIAFESRKILGLPGLSISATTVRVPVKRCHAMALWVRLSRPADAAGVERVLADAPGVEVAEPPPCPAELEGTDPVYVGRIRQDPDDEQAFWMWAVSDQLRKGAALNAIQIAEVLHGYGRIRE